MASLVVQTSFIGDVILTTPLIAALAQRDAVDVVTTPAGAAVLKNNPHIRSLISYDKRQRDRGVGGFSRLVAQLSSNRESRNHNSAYMAQGSWRSAALALGARYRERVGFDTSDGRPLYTTRISYRDDWHHTRRLLALAGMQHAADATPAMLRPQLFPEPGDVAAVDALLENRSAPFIVLAPGSVWATKRWPYYEALSALLAQHFDIALVGGSDDKPIAEHIIATAPNPSRIINAVGALSLLGSAELIGRSRAIVTNDSSPQHLASAMGTPTVTIFGPTVPSFGFGPLAPNSKTMGIDTLPCRPCDRHGPRTCPLGHWKCMREMAPEDVRDILLSIAGNR